MVARWNGDGAEQDVAAQDRRRLAVHAGDPTRIVGVAEHQPGIGRSSGVNPYAVRRVLGNGRLALSTAIGRDDIGLSGAVVGQDDLLVGVKRAVHHLAQGGAQARRNTCARHEKRSWEGGGVLEDADLVILVDLAVLRFGFAEELVDRAIGAHGDPAKHRQLAHWRHYPQDQGRGAHRPWENQVRKRQLPLARLAAALVGHPSRLDTLVLDLGPHIRQVPAPVHRVTPGLELSRPDDLVGGVPQFQLGNRRSLRHVHRAHHGRNETQLNHRRVHVEGEALLGEGAAAWRMHEGLLRQEGDALIAGERPELDRIQQVAHVPQVEQAVVDVQHPTQVVAVPDELERAVPVGFLHGSERCQAVGGQLVERWGGQDSVRTGVLRRQLLDGTYRRGFGGDSSQRLSWMDAPGEDQQIDGSQSGNDRRPTAPGRPPRALP